MAMHLNFEGLTYVWHYGNMVNVYDQTIAVDAFVIGVFDDEPVTYSDFLASVIRWSQYIGTAAFYSSENSF